MLDASSTPNQRLRKKDLTRKERATHAQLRSGYCKLPGSYKSRIKKDASLDVCADCGKTSHDVRHLFACPAHPTTLIPSDLWSKPVESIPEFSYLEEGKIDCDKPRPKENNNSPLLTSTSFLPRVSSKQLNGSSLRAQSHQDDDRTKPNSSRWRVTYMRTQTKYPCPVCTRNVTSR